MKTELSIIIFTFGVVFVILMPLFDDKEYDDMKEFKIAFRVVTAFLLIVGATGIIKYLF